MNKLYEGCWVETEDSQIWGPVHNAKSTAAPANVGEEYVYWANSVEGGWQNWNACGETRQSRDLGFYVKTVYPSDPRESKPTVSVVSRMYKELTTDHIKAFTHDVSTGIWLVQNRKTGDQITVNNESLGDLLAVLGKMKEANDE